MGVVVLRRYIDILTIIINFPYSTCISAFFGSSIPTSLFILKMFFRSLSIYSQRYIGTAGDIYMGRRPCQNWIYKSAPTFINPDQHLYALAHVNKTAAATATVGIIG